MGRVIFINRFYWPETPATGQLLTDLATGLCSRGENVLIITSGTATHTASRETHDGVQIIRVRSPRWAHTSVAGKAIAFFAFLCGATFHGLRKARRDDVIVAMTDPPMLGVAAWVIAKLRGSRLIHWVQDVYPEVAIAVTGQAWLKVLRPLRNASWRGAIRCVVLGQAMANLVRAAMVHADRVVVIPNWAPAGVVKLAATDSLVSQLREEWSLTGKFVVAYSGNLGRVHDLMPVIEAAALLRADENIVFAFIGHGPQHEALQKHAAKRQLSHIRFFPPQPRERLSTSLAVADVHLVTLRRGCESVVFPSKIYGIAAAGRPMVFIGSPDCEIAELIRSNELGLVADSRNPAVLADIVRRLACNAHERETQADAAGRFAAEHTAARAIAAWETLIATAKSC